MINIDSIADRAVKLFNSGWNCSESVFLAVSENIVQKDNFNVNLLTALGGGIGHSGLTCGALTGAVVVIGIKYGRKEIDAQAKQKAYIISKNIVTKFRGRFQTVNCSELLKKVKDKDHKKRLCSEYVRQAAKLAASAILAAKDSDV